MFINLSRNYKNLMLISATIIASSIIFFGISIISNIYAQSAEKITITLNSAKLAPLTNGTHIQLKAIVGYVTKDNTLVNTKIDGMMKVTLANGTLIKRSSFPNGFTVSQSGTIQFATSFIDKTIQNAKVDIVLTDITKTKPLSNIVTGNVSLDNTPVISKKAPLSTNTINSAKPIP